jgi:hypothetical protein
VEGPGEGLANILANRRIAWDVLRREGPCAPANSSALMNSLSQGLGDCSEQHSSTILSGLAAFVVCGAFAQHWVYQRAEGVPPCIVKPGGVSRLPPLQFPRLFNA